MPNHIYPFTNSNNENNLKEKILKGSSYLYAFQIFSKTVKPVFTIFIIRILSPADFGVIAIANIIIAGLRRFEQFGLNTALIRSEKLSEELKSNGNTMKFIISAILILFAFIISPHWASLYGIDSVSNIIRILSLTFIINSFVFVDTVVLVRNMDFKNQVIPDVIRTLISPLITLLLAYFLPSLPFL